MREIHNPQASIFEFYGEHETGQQLKFISSVLDDNPSILDIAAKVLIDPETKVTGRNGLTVDSIVRAGLLKQMMGLTYNELSFYLQDSLTYGAFSRIDHLMPPSKTSLQSRSVKLTLTAGKPSIMSCWGMLPQRALKKVVWFALTAQ